MSMDAGLGGPVCLEHSDRVAMWTCSRCGRFACEACVDAQRICTQCVGRQVLSLSSSTPRARWAGCFLLAHAVTDALTALLITWALLSGPSVPRKIAEGLVGLGASCLAIATPIAFLMWLHLAVRQTRALGIDVGASPRWAVGCWFIPFVNLVKPYRIVRALVNGLGGKKALVSAGHLGLWWGLWLLGNLQWRSQTEVSTRDHVEVSISSDTYIVAILRQLASVSSAILCVGIVRAAQRALDAWRVRRALGLAQLPTE
ncbi:DUF4328 domain-containing protein [Archangium sp.]|uniref:DUF4328 domain-containing protein n=1 Tax=Archangium sp. TaxID=1872627 RepID=UPI00389AC824